GALGGLLFGGRGTHLTEAKFTAEADRRGHGLTSHFDWAAVAVFFRVSHTGFAGTVARLAGFGFPFAMLRLDNLSGCEPEAKWFRRDSLVKSQQRHLTYSRSETNVTTFVVHVREANGLKVR